MRRCCKHIFVCLCTCIFLLCMAVVALYIMANAKMDVGYIKRVVSEAIGVDESQICYVGGGQMRWPIAIYKCSANCMNIDMLICLGSEGGVDSELRPLVNSQHIEKKQFLNRVLTFYDVGFRLDDNSNVYGVKNSLSVLCADVGHDFLIFYSTN